MSSLQRLLGLSILVTLTGCSAAALPVHPGTATAAPPAPPSASFDLVRSDRARDAESDATLRAALDLTAGAPAPPPAAPATCAAEPDKKGYFGFYANDGWEKGDVVLTFDDGPHPTATPRVLDELAAHHYQATFFVIGRAITRDTYPLLQRMVAEGHTIGSHTYSHDVKMTRVEAPERSVEDIRGQHETTAILVDLALMAKSGDDFDAMYKEVFQSDPAHWLEQHTIRQSYADYLVRHRALLRERGYAEGTRPYAVLYSRPPGGGPYVEHDGAAGIKIYDEALEKLGMMNVLWHGASGDTDPAHKRELGTLTKNIDKVAKAGGVLLIHDYMRSDALVQGLDDIAKSDAVHVITMGEAVRRKYGCESGPLGVELADAAGAEVLGRGALASVSATPAVTGPLSSLLSSPKPR